MPLKLVPPRAGKSPYWYVRGVYRGVTVDRSTKTTERAKALRALKLWEEDIERGDFARPGEPTFIDAATNYIAATGNERFVKPLVEHFAATRIRDISQQMIDAAAISLYPKAAAATRNRQVYTVMSAILKHAGVKEAWARPKGSRGKKRTDWMTPDQAFRLIEAAYSKDAEFGAFLTFLLYTGCRLSEALSLPVDRLAVAESFAYVAETKNDDPRPVHLPPAVVTALANHPRGLDRPGERVFRMTKCGRLYTWLGTAKKAAGADVSFVTFHTFRHTWATWMRRYAGLDVRGLVGTGAWRDMASAERYQHVEVSEEARRADLLPVKNSWKRGNGTSKPA